MKVDEWLEMPLDDVIKREWKSWENGNSAGGGSGGAGGGPGAGGSTADAPARSWASTGGKVGGRGGAKGSGRGRSRALGVASLPARSSWADTSKGRGRSSLVSRSARTGLRVSRATGGIVKAALRGVASRPRLGLGSGRGRGRGAGRLAGDAGWGSGWSKGREGFARGRGRGRDLAELAAAPRRLTQGVLGVRGRLASSLRLESRAGKAKGKGKGKAEPWAKGKGRGSGALSLTDQPGSRGRGRGKDAEIDAWARARGSGKGGSNLAGTRRGTDAASLDALSEEDRSMMKKITIVAQLDKVPEPLPFMSDWTGSRPSGAIPGSLSSRFGANFGR